MAVREPLVSAAAIGDTRSAHLWATRQTSAAHLRHWRDAELLFEHRRWANADQLYGLSAECGLKALMVDLGMEVTEEDGRPARPEHRQHVNALWSEFVSFAIGNSFQYLDMLPEPFDDWSTADRYAHGSHFSDAGVSPHRSAADAVRKMMQTAQLDRAR